MQTTDELLDKIENLTDSLAETSRRLAAAEDTLFLILKILDHVDDGDHIAGAIWVLATNRRNDGNAAVADILEQTVTALALKAFEKQASREEPSLPGKPRATRASRGRKMSECTSGMRRVLDTPNTARIRSLTIQPAQKEFR